MKSRSLPLAAAALFLTVCSIEIAVAQQRTLPNREAFDMYARAVQLMESTSLAMPELARAGGPITENARHAATTLRSLGRQNGGVTYSLLANLRAFLLLTDSL